MENKQEYDNYIMLSKGAEAELVEKKSRFIATVRPVSSEEEAVAFIEEMKMQKHYRTNSNAFGDIDIHFLILPFGLGGVIILFMLLNYRIYIVFCNLTVC